MGVVATSDGYINIGAGGQGQWKSLCVALDRPGLAEHPQYASQDLRYRNRPQLMAELGTVSATRTSAEWLEALEAGGVPAGPIYRMDEVFADPQVQHLKMAADLHHPVRGDIRVVAQPIGLSRTPASVVTPIPEPGEHTDEILTEYGFSRNDIQELRSKRIV
jgi:crotonobetainyl-CoA:carnitine CoA-transferase CaiB-like acyl-CoA transferase